MKNLAGKRIAVIGAGVAGLSAAKDLARLGVDVTLVEKSDTLGGRAAGYGCKATERCVKCGACMVVEAVREVEASPAVEIRLSSAVRAVKRNGGHLLTIETKNDSGAESAEERFDAVVLATGFSPYDPSEKPYGYKIFPNVVTNLELEAMIRRLDRVARPSDGEAPKQMAFIQCVGSRDGKLGHLWCSQVCCGSALRMARWVISRRPDTEITFFYIDVQTFGKDFELFYQTVRDEIKMIRMLPGDLYPAPADGIKAVFFDPESRKEAEMVFDMVVLSIGITPGRENGGLASMFGVPANGDGFLAENGNGTDGVFAAGAACGPMSIPDAIQNANNIVQNVVQYLEKG